MNDLVRANAATAAEWPDLVDELDRWGEAGRVATLWWRDDDAVTATPQLDDLLSLAGGIHVGLAVIPARARPELADALQGAPDVAVLQHGWQHANRAANGRKSEYPEGRPAAVVAAEVGAGRDRLKALFGSRALPVLVPPWNRFAGEFLPLLPAAGIAGLSAMASRRETVPSPALRRTDVHVDVVAWRGGRGFVGNAAALSTLVGCLQARRLGVAAMSGPIGILTHHLIMDDGTAAFLDRLIALTAAHAAARWANITELLQ